MSAKNRSQLIGDLNKKKCIMEKSFGSYFSSAIFTDRRRNSKEVSVISEMEYQKKEDNQLFDVIFELSKA